VDPVLARLIAERPDFDPRAWMAHRPPMDLYGAYCFRSRVAFLWRKVATLRDLASG
jgi:hypothetical protein